MHKEKVATFSNENVRGKTFVMVYDAGHIVICTQRLK